MSSLALPTRRIADWLLAAVVIVVMSLVPGMAMAASGYWRYQRIELSPPQSQLDETARNTPPGRVWEAHVSGAFQAEFAGKGTIKLYFKTDDADRHVFLSQVTYNFGAGRDMAALIPGQKINMVGSVSIESNYPGARGGGTMWVNNGDNFLVIDTPVDKQGSTEASFTVPSGGGTLQLSANGGLYNDGALHETVTIFYEWIEGPAPPQDQTEEQPPMRGDLNGSAGGFGGSWSTSEGDMSLDRSGTEVTGTYSQDNGHIGGDMRGNHLIGYWGEDSSAQQCETKRLGTLFWGKIDWTLAADGKSFDGLWSYCDAAPSSSWTGQRTGETKPSTSGEIVIIPDNGGVNRTEPDTSGNDRPFDNGQGPVQDHGSPAVVGGEILGSNGDAIAGHRAQSFNSSSNWGVGGSAQSGKVFDNWNTAACKMTDAATLDLNRPLHLDRFSVWVNWQPNERSTEYRVLSGGEDIGGGILRRGDCDPYQGNWCSGTDSPNVDLRPGRYKIRIDHQAICQNAGSNGAGFVRAWGH